MDPAVVVSPHLDDAVLSCGQFLAGRPDAQVLTVFTACPERGDLSTSYDRNCGFQNATAAHAGRTAEDRAALDILGATGTHLDYLDHQYREVLTGATVALETWIANDLAVQIAVIGEALDAPVLVLAPLGLKHPDHHITARAAEAAVKHLGDKVELWVYEDLPSRVLWPEEVPEQLKWWRGMGWDPVNDFVGTGDQGLKEQAIDCYASQLWALDRHAILCPERMWRCWPS